MEPLSLKTDPALHLGTPMMTAFKYGRPFVSHRILARPGGCHGS